MGYGDLGEAGTYDIRDDGGRVERLLKAMYVMGENPVFNLPDSGATEAALKKLEFLVVQDIFLTETAKLADVVLPALSWAEKDGSFTNMERRIQRLRKAVHREGMEDWKIVAEVSRNMGGKFSFEDAESVFHEISNISPLHRNLAYEDLEAGHAIYPYKVGPRDVMEEYRSIKRAINVPGSLFICIPVRSAQRPRHW
jgi:predicted molibdopterin-dependent oxidoreductase YjgC